MTMPAQSIPELMTAEELEHLHVPGKSAELVRGEDVLPGFACALTDVLS